MSQQLIQVKKYLEIEDIIPQWVDTLTGKTRYDPQIMCIRKHSCCMVGEAHGGNSDYIDVCMECNHHSGFATMGDSIYNDIMLYYGNNIEEELSTDPLTLDELKEMPGVKAFVKHWNECHV